MKAAIYARYSSDNQREESIHAQVRAIEEYAIKNKIQIVRTYVDEAKSATTDNRPQFLQLMKDIDKKSFDTLVVHKLDRFARNRYDSAFYKRKLRNANVRLVSVTENLDGSPESVIMESVLEGMAEYYSKNLAREVMKGMKETAYQCKHNGGKPPLGYDVLEDKTYAINEIEAETIKIIFNMYNSNKSYQDIMQYLNSNGLKTKAGQQFKKTSIHDILHNEKYCGVFVFNKTRREKTSEGERNTKKSIDEHIRVEGGIPNIITREEYLMAQKKLKEHEHIFRQFNTKEIYILSGKLFCGYCGARMSGSRRLAGRNKEVYRSYQCSNRKILKTCPKKESSANMIEKEVIEYLERKVFTDENINIIADELYDLFNKKIKESTNTVKLFDSKIIKVQKEIDNIVNAISKGMFQDSMKNKLDSLEIEKNEIQNMILDEKIRYSEKFTKAIIIEQLLVGKNLSQKDKISQQSIINQYVDKVIVYDDGCDIIVHVGGGGGAWQSTYTISK